MGFEREGEIEGGRYKKCSALHQYVPVLVAMPLRNHQIKNQRPPPYIYIYSFQPSLFIYSTYWPASPSLTSLVTPPSFILLNSSLLQNMFFLKHQIDPNRSYPTRIRISWSSGVQILNDLHFFLKKKHQIDRSSSLYYILNHIIFRFDNESFYIFFTSTFAYIYRYGLFCTNAFNWFMKCNQVNLQEGTKLDVLLIINTRRIIYPVLIWYVKC